MGFLRVRGEGEGEDGPAHVVGQPAEDEGQDNHSCGRKTQEDVNRSINDRSLCYTYTRAQMCKQLNVHFTRTNDILHVRIKPKMYLWYMFKIRLHDNYLVLLDSGLFFILTCQNVLVVC